MDPLSGPKTAASTLIPLGVLFVALGGCVQDPGSDGLGSPDVPDDVAVPAGPVTDLTQIPLGLGFAPPVLLDKVRPGGEPVIVVTPKGTILVSSHPGYTHLFLGSDLPPNVDPNWPQSLSGENMLWRSTDGGQTWTYIGLPVANAGPRDAAYGISDPDITIDAKGTIFLVHLYIPFMSMSRSTDDGATWIGNPVAETLPFPANDRPWLASYEEDEVWLVTHGNVWKSVPGSMGLVYQPQSDVNAGSGGNINADPRDGTLYIRVGTNLLVSTDRGASWKKGAPGPEGGGGGGGLNLGEPAIDAAGNVYVSYFQNGTLYYAAWSPKAERFLGAHAVAKLPGTHVWPWIVAGDEGRVAIVWLGSDNPGGPDQPGNWRLYAAIIEGAAGSAPFFTVGEATKDPIHKGELCQSGVGCVGRGDRRLGDFLTAAIDLEGRLLISSGATQTGVASADDGGISHPIFVKQVDGPRLRGGATAPISTAAP